MTENKIGYIYLLITRKFINFGQFMNKMGNTAQLGLFLYQIRIYYFLFQFTLLIERIIVLIYFESIAV